MVIWILWTNCPSIQVIAAFLLTSAQKRCRLERPICTVSTANSRQLHPFHLVAIIWTSKLTQSSFTFFKLRVWAIFKWKFQTALLLVLLLLLLLLLGAARMATLLRNDGAPARPLSVCLTVSLSLSLPLSLSHSHRRPCLLLLPSRLYQLFSCWQLIVSITYLELHPVTPKDGPWFNLSLHMFNFQGIGFHLWFYKGICWTITW